MLLSCTTAQIPNVQFTASLGASGALQFDLLDAKTSRLTLLQFSSYWNDLSNKSGPPVCMRSGDWAKLKLALEELCSWMQGGCSTDQQQALDNFTKEVGTLK